MCGFLLLSYSRGPMDDTFERRLLQYMQHHPDASHGEISRAFTIRTASNVRSPGPMPSTIVRS